MKIPPQFSWLPLAAALLALLSTGTALAGNRYDERKADPKYEARGDEDQEPPAQEEMESAPDAPEAAVSAEAPAEAPAPEEGAEASAEPAPEEADSTADTEPPAPLPPLPARDQVSVALGTQLEEGTFSPIEAGTDFDANMPGFFARVTIQGDAEYGLNGCIVVEQVAGAAAGEEVSRADCDEYVGEHREVVLRFAIPETGLRPGRYRVEIVEAGAARRVITSAGFTAKLPLLPAEGRLRIGLHEAGQPPEVLTCGELPSAPERLFATLETLDPTTLRVTANIVSEEAAGVPAGRTMASITNYAFVDLVPGQERATLQLGLPRCGLPPGRYRVEFREFAPPYRVLKSAGFTTRETRGETAPFNLADPENGGLLESVTGEDGAGLTWAWRTLRPGNQKTWQTDESRAAGTLPCELVLSFYRRELAMVGAVEVEPSDGAPGPRKIEVWGSMVSAREGFQKVAEKSWSSAEGVELCVVPVPSSLMRYVKIRFVDAQGGEGQVGVRTVRVLEAKAEGYQSLRQRCPDLRDWRLQPRHAAQQGLYFLQASAVEFQRQNSCLGCHVQSQALMGLSVARKSDYVVSEVVDRELAGFTLACAAPVGDIRRAVVEGDNPDLTNTAFAALGLAYARPEAPVLAGLGAAARWLATVQEPEGQMWPDSEHEPVSQGEILQTAHVMQVWAAALAAGGEPALGRSLERALAWVVAAPAETTQDKVFKILVCLRHGGAAEKKLARQLCQQLLGEQGADGAWRVRPEEPSSVPSPFATGQVLYALRQAGFSPNAPSFRRGVQWLILGQDEDASWRAADTESPFASTMWPVIALTGSFSNKAEPARINVTALARPAPPIPPAAPPVAVVAKAVPKAILLVFDCSFSMTEKIRGRAKFDIAKEVLREVIGKLPDDTRVGLRLYGHRHGSMTSESRTDTQLVVPIGPLDRTKLLQTIAAAKALGQTPMVLSTLAAGEDLKKAGGGILIVVTDGAESCGGKPRKAGAQLAELGVPLRLDVIGFALTGRRVVDEMTAFAAPTGGRFYTAADGLQLAHALKEAVSPAPTAAPPRLPPPPPPPEPEDYAYEVFDAQGLSVARSSTLSGEPPELAPGVYRVALSDGAQTAALDGLKLAEGQTLELRYDPAKGTLEYMP